MKISRFLRLGVILPQPGQLRPDSSNSYGLDALVSNVNTYAVNLDNLSQSGLDITLTGQQAIVGVVRLIGAASNNFTVTLPPTARLIDALGPTIPKDGSFAVEISIQNEDPTYTATLTAGDASTTINGTTIIAAGTRRIWLLTVGTPYDSTVASIQNIGTFSTSSTIAGSGTVTSVGIAVPAELTISGSPVTSAGTMTIGKANETANTVWAGPTSGGAAQPTFRTLVLGDLPGGVGSGSVTSVAMTVPTEFSVSGSPITTSGTLAITKATESANTVWAGPATGVPAQPAFRALVAADLPSSLNLSQTFITQATEATLANSRVLTAGSNITITDAGPGSTITVASTAGGGTLKSTAFTANGTFTPDTGVTAVWVSGSGGGGGGSTRADARGGGGGGAGEYCEMVAVTVSGAVTVTVGGGGAGGASGVVNANGTAGSNTTFGSLLTMLGGAPGDTASNGGAGGGPRGAAGGAGGTSPGAGAIGAQESPSYFGGSSAGGGYSSTVGGNGAAGGAAPGLTAGAVGGTGNGSSLGGGGGGGAGTKGIGGAGGNFSTAGSSAAANTGAGGGGAGGQTGGNALAAGNGGSGWLTVFWIG